VTGVSAYSAQDVIDVSDIEIGDSIFFIRESVSVAKIKSAMAYVDEVRISRTLPDKVTIEVTESYPIASLTSGGKWWIIDKNAKILEQTGSAGVSGTIVLKGVEPVMPAVGDTLELGDTGTVRLMYLKAVLAMILSEGMQDDVSWLDMSNISAIKFDYKNYVINLGKGESLEDKLWLLQQFFGERGEDGSGTIDLSIENEAHYIPS
jgi:cell division protein FtsQ